MMVVHVAEYVFEGIQLHPCSWLVSQVVQNFLQNWRLWVFPSQKLIDIYTVVADGVLHQDERSVVPLIDFRVGLTIQTQILRVNISNIVEVSDWFPNRYIASQVSRSSPLLNELSLVLTIFHHVILNVYLLLVAQTILTMKLGVPSGQVLVLLIPGLRLPACPWLLTALILPLFRPSPVSEIAQMIQSIIYFVTVVPISVKMET